MKTANARNAKGISYILAMILLVTTIINSSSIASYGAAVDGSNVLDLHTGDTATVTFVKRNAYYTTANGTPLGAGVYFIQGGNFNDQFLYCLENGLTLPSGSMNMQINDIYKFSQNPETGRIDTIYDQDNKPVPNDTRPTLNNGYTFTNQDVWGIDAMLQYASYYEYYQPTFGIEGVEASYAAQFAIWAYVNAVSGRTAPSLTLRFDNDCWPDASGRLCTGNIKAASTAQNNMIRFSQFLYNTAMKARSDYHSALLHYVNFEEQGTAVTNADGTVTYKVKVTTKNLPWELSPDTKAYLASNTDVKVMPVSGNTGEEITITLPQSKVQSFELKCISRWTHGTGNVYFAVPGASGYQNMIGMNTKERTHIQGSWTPYDIPIPASADEPEPIGIQIEGEKEDSEGGFDVDIHTGRGDADLRAGFELYIDGAYKETFYSDIYGRNAISDTYFPFENLVLTETASHREWEQTVTVEIREVKPAHYLSEADGSTGNSTGIRSYNVTYTAQCDKVGGDWGEIEYKVSPPDSSFSSSTDVRTIGSNRATFVNRVEKGELLVEKTKEKDLDPFGEIPSVKEPMENAKFTLALAGAGYESHPTVRAIKINSGQPGYDPAYNSYRIVNDNSGVRMDGSSGDDSFFITNEFGKIRIFDIPYGVYVLREIEASEEGYVLTTELVNITRDKEIVVKHIVDYVIRDKLVVRKVDSETGKTVQEDGIVFRLRYIGNPNTPEADRKNDKNYGKYLTQTINGVDTQWFKTDQYGEVSFPYPLQYGIYQLEEIVAPQGYYIGLYDGVGTASAVDHDKGFYDTVTIYDSSGFPVIYDGNLNEYPYTTQTVTIAAMGANPDDYPVIEIVQKNNSVKGKIDITKLAETIIGFTEKETEFGTLNEPIIEHQPKDGVTFDIFAKTDTQIPDGIDSPLFVDGNLKVIPLETTLINHALWKDALKVEETVLKDGTELSFVTQRFQNNILGKTIANLLTATKGSNMYTLEYDQDNQYDSDYTDHYVFIINSEYTADGYTSSRVEVEKTTTLKNGVVADKTPFPSTTALTVSSGADIVDQIADYYNHRFANGNEMTIEYMNTLDVVTTDEGLMLTPLTGYQNLYDPDSKYFVYTNDMQDEFYTAVWKDETRSEQVWVYSDLTDKRYSNYKNTASLAAIDLSLPVYVTQGSISASAVITPAGMEYLSAESISLDKFLFTDDPASPSAYKVAVTPDPQTIEYLTANASGEAIYEPYTSADFEILKDYTLDISKSLENEQYMYTKVATYDAINSSAGSAQDFLDLPEYVTLVTDGANVSWVECNTYGLYINTRVEKFNTTIYKVPGASDIITFEFDGLKVTADSDAKNGIVTIEKPSQVTENYVLDLAEETTYTDDGTTVVMTMEETKPSAYMQMNDKTLVGVMYAGGYVMTTIKVPEGNKYPTLYYQGKETDMTVNDMQERLSLNFPFIEVVPASGGSDRITAELVAPTQDEGGYTLFTIVTQETAVLGGNNNVQFEFPDGRNMDVGIVTDQNGLKRGSVQVECLTKTYRYLLGELVQSVTTGLDNDNSGQSSTGKAISKELPLGSYIVRERGTTEEIVVADGDYEVNLEYAGQYVPLIWGSTTVENEMASMQLNAQKLFQKAHGSSSYEPKAGAVFGVFAGQQLQAKQALSAVVTKTALNRGDLIGLLTSDKDGLMTEEFKALYGMYYLKELKTLPGYILNEYDFPFTYGADVVEDTLSMTLTDKGIQIDIRYNGNYNLDAVVKTLDQLPMPEYAINGVPINTTKSGIIPIPNAKTELTFSAIDRITKTNVRENPVSFDFGDNDILRIYAGEKSYRIEFDQDVGKNTLSYKVPADGYTLGSSMDTTTQSIGIEFEMPLNNITYKAEAYKVYDDAMRPAMKLNDSISIYRETAISQGTDKLIFTGLTPSGVVTDLDLTTSALHTNRLQIDVNQITDGATQITLPGINRTVELTKINGNITFGTSPAAMFTNKNGVIPSSNYGLQADGSYITAGSVTYYTSNLGVDDSANSESVLSQINAVFVDGTLMLQNVPVSVYKDGVLEPGLISDTINILNGSDYTVILADGTTQVNITVLNGKEYVSLTGVRTQNFNAYAVPQIVSQGLPSLIQDGSRNVITQKPGTEFKTIDNITGFTRESRTYQRADAFANVVQIDINTFNAQLVAIGNSKLPETPTRPSTPKDPKEPKEPKPTEPAITGKAILKIEKTPEKTIYNVGETGGYTVKVTQTEKNQIAENIVLNDKFDKTGVEFIKDSAKVMFNETDITKQCDITWNSDGYTIKTYQNLAYGDALKVTYNVTYKDKALAGQKVTNAVVASSDNTDDVDTLVTVEVRDGKLIVLLDDSGGKGRAGFDTGDDSMLWLYVALLLLLSTFAIYRLHRTKRKNVSR